MFGDHFEQGQGQYNRNKSKIPLLVGIKAILSKAEVSAMHNSSGIALSVGINCDFEKD